MNVFDLMATLSLDSSSYVSALNGARSLGQGTVDTLGGVFSRLASTAGSVLKNVASQAYQMAKQFVSSSIEVGSSFESAMSQVSATMGYSVSDIENNVNNAAETMQKLENFAAEMGATTAFTSTQAAQALNYMALAGYTADQSIAVLPSVLNLAAAGSIELGAASDMVTDALSALGLGVSDAVDFVDKMAVTASKSNTSVEQLGNAILTVGGTAKVLSGETVELDAALGILADNGIKGAEGGTKLRNILLSLTAPTEKAQKVMKELGVTAVDATTGAMRPLADIFADLDSALYGMDIGTKESILSDLFNKQDLAAVEAYLATAKSRWNELAGYISESEGAAAEMAEMQLDNLAGDKTLLESAIDGLKTAFYGIISDDLRTLVQRATSEVGKITDALKTDGLEGAIKQANDSFQGFLKDLQQEAQYSDFPLLQLVGTIMGGINQLLTIATGLLSDVAGWINNIATLISGPQENKLADHLQEIQINADKALESADEQATKATALIEAIDELQKKEALTDEDRASWAQYTERLVALYPELSKYVDEETGYLKGNADAIRSEITALRDLQKEKIIQQAAEKQQQLLMDKYEQYWEKQAKANEQRQYVKTYVVEDAQYIQTHANKLGLNLPEELKNYDFTDFSDMESYQFNTSWLNQWLSFQNYMSEWANSSNDEEKQFSKAAQNIGEMSDKWDDAAGKAKEYQEQADLALEQYNQAYDDFQQYVTACEEEISKLTTTTNTSDDAASKLKSTIDSLPSKKVITVQVRNSTIDLDSGSAKSKYNVSERLNALEDLKVEGSYASGIDYVPYDMVAQLHKGEQVVTANNAADNRKSEGIDLTSLASTISNAILQAMTGLQINMSGERVADLVTERVSQNIYERARGLRYA